ncbi:hypothetical protein C8A05DRAFT_37872 [Staphylotrichum tortipilum]|uniref:Uncharacterized protein n=1 Tax=Staphylotrichum tortipilum TaxID=2831512 RepID=A0AAN6MEL9_9PEZI|nr:hypothetical protein C8A05DRAFT_37872 [Staphylotrichum longicolle]
MAQPPHPINEAVNDSAQTGTCPLTWINLHEFTAAERRQRAHQRGRSTPSTNPDFHEYEAGGPVVYDLEKTLSPEELARVRNMTATLPSLKGPASLEKLSTPELVETAILMALSKAARSTVDDPGEGGPRKDNNDDDQPATTTPPNSGVGNPPDPGNLPAPETNNDQEPSFPGPPVYPSILQHRPKIPRYHPRQHPNQPSSASASTSASASPPPPSALPTFPTF